MNVWSGILHLFISLFILLFVGLMFFGHAEFSSASLGSIIYSFHFLNFYCGLQMQKRREKDCPKECDFWFDPSGRLFKGQLQATFMIVFRMSLVKWTCFSTFYTNIRGLTAKYFN